MKQKYNVGDIVKHKALSGNFKVMATKDQPYDRRGSSPYNDLIRVRENYDYKIILIKDDNKISPFIDTSECELF